MAAILSYKDCRLFGEFLVARFNQSVSSLTKKSNSIHSKTSILQRISICAKRAFCALAASIGIVLFFAPALIGSVTKVVHYHILSEEYRQQPAVVKIYGMELPFMSSYRPSKPIREKIFYHGTSKTVNIVNYGFDTSRTKENTSVLGDAIYVSFKDWVSPEYGNTRFHLNLNLKNEEVAEVDFEFFNRYWKPEARITFNKNLGWWQKLTLSKTSRDRLFSQKIRELFLKNGFRAAKYNFVVSHNMGGQSEAKALAVYDLSCITIKKYEACC